MITKQAIIKAIEGRWKPWEYVGQPEDSFTDILADNKNDQAMIALDPLFWQALGKSLGWDESTFHRVANGIEYQEYAYDEVWRLFAHRFYDLILTNGDINKFWADLGITDI